MALAVPSAGDGGTSMLAWCSSASFTISTFSLLAWVGDVQQGGTGRSRRPA